MRNSPSSDSDGWYHSGGGGGRREDSREFRDDIPLRTKTEQRQDSHDSGDMERKQANMEERKVEDPEARPRRKRRKIPEKKGFFSGKVPWVVYGLTLIQLSVFIAELVKNGMFML
jgi:hypothetical protein